MREYFRRWLKRIYFIKVSFELALQLDQFSVLLSIFLVPVSLLSTLLLTSVSLLSILLKPVSRVCRLIPVSKVCIRFNCLRRPGGAGLQVRCHHFFNCQVKSQSIELEREISTRLGTKMMKMKTPLSRFRMFAIVAKTRANLWFYQSIFNLYNLLLIGHRFKWKCEENCVTWSSQDSLRLFQRAQGSKWDQRL